MKKLLAIIFLSALSLFAAGAKRSDFYKQTDISKIQAAIDNPETSKVDRQYLKAIKVIRSSQDWAACQAAATADQITEEAIQSMCFSCQVFIPEAMTLSVKWCWYKCLYFDRIWKLSGKSQLDRYGYIVEWLEKFGPTANKGRAAGIVNTCHKLTTVLLNAGVSDTKAKADLQKLNRLLSTRLVEVPELEKAVAVIRTLLATY